MHNIFDDPHPGIYFEDEETLSRRLEAESAFIHYILERLHRVENAVAEVVAEWLRSMKMKPSEYRRVARELIDTLEEHILENEEWEEHMLTHNPTTDPDWWKKYYGA